MSSRWVLEMIVFHQLRRRPLRVLAKEKTGARSLLPFKPMLFRPDTDDEKLTQTYRWSIIIGGAAVYFLAAYWLNPRLIDLRLGAVAFLTLFLSSRITIKIPQFNSQISVSDTFIFLTLLLYGSEAAILMAATEALLSSLRFCRKSTTVLFNWGCAALSTCITAFSLHFLFGDAIRLSSAP